MLKSHLETEKTHSCFNESFRFFPFFFFFFFSNSKYFRLILCFVQVDNFTFCLTIYIQEKKEKRITKKKILNVPKDFSVLEKNKMCELKWPPLHKAHLIFDLFVEQVKIYKFLLNRIKFHCVDKNKWRKGGWRNSFMLIVQLSTWNNIIFLYSDNN